jgi:hypothetical protein
VLFLLLERPRERHGPQRGREYFREPWSMFPGAFLGLSYSERCFKGGANLVRAFPVTLHIFLVLQIHLI